MNGCDFRKSMVKDLNKDFVTSTIMLVNFCLNDDEVTKFNLLV